MKSVLCVLAALCVPNSFGAKADRSAAAEAQAVILDHNAFGCENCLFGMNDYYVCFQAGDKILIGHDKVRTQMRHQTPTVLTQTGATVPIRFDDEYIWVGPSGSKELRLKQDYTTRIFVQNKKCQAATR